MSVESEWQNSEKIFEVFKNIVEPSLQELIEEYDGVGGFEAKIVSDCPIITGIEVYDSIMFQHPEGFEMIICVYWVRGSDKIIAENISMVTLNKALDIYQVTKDSLKHLIKFLAGIEMMKK